MNSEKFLDWESAAKIIKAVTMHFKHDRDITKYGWKTVKLSTRTMMDEATIIQQILNRYQTDYRLLTAMGSFAVREPSCWVGKVLTYENEYYHLKKWNMEPSRMFEEELTQMLKTTEFKEIFRSENVKASLIRGDMTPEFIVALNRVIPIIKVMDSNLKDDYAWEMIRGRFIKYGYYLKFKDEKVVDNIKQIILKYKS